MSTPSAFVFSAWSHRSLEVIYYSHLQRYRLFDLASDPHELRSFARPENQGIKTELQRKLRDWFGPRTAPYNAPKDRRSPRR